MPNGSDNPDLRDVWNSVNESRRELAELKGMLNVHFSDHNIHHNPPCHAAEEMRKTMLSAAGAAILALLAAIGSIITSILR
jgi:hypothetical protein